MNLRPIIFSAILVLYYSLINAQSWEPVGGGIYASDKVFEIGEYKDTIRPQVYTLCVYNEKLYAGGLFTFAEKLHVNNVAKWDGKKWDSLGSGTNGSVQSFGIHKNLLLVGGTFEKAGGKLARGIAIWVDTFRTIPSWYYYPRGVYKIPIWNSKGNKQINNHLVYAICDFEEETYIGGEFCLTEDCIGDHTQSFSFWNPGKKVWEPVTNNVPDSINMDSFYELKCLIVYKDKLYAIGWQYDNFRRKYIIVWNGTYLSKLADLTDVRIDFKCAAISDSGLYFAGYAPSKQSKTYPIVRLNNDGTYKLIEALPSRGTINSMVFYNGKLYVAGIFSMIDGKLMNNIACWDGKSWQPLGTGLSNDKKHFAEVKSLCIYNGDLYAAGSFNHSGNTEVLNIAKYNLAPGKTRRK